MTTTKEKIEIAALVAEIVGAIAVVVSVVYLAVQVSEGNEQLKSQTHYNALMLGQIPIEIELRSGVLSDIIDRGYRDPGQLTPTEWYRFTQYQVMALNGWEFYYYENDKGTMPKPLWIGANAYYTKLIRTKPGLQQFWHENRHVYAEPFASYVDRIIETSALD
jgi:hypothetical protein